MKIYQIIKNYNSDKSITVLKFITALKIYHCDGENEHLQAFLFERYNLHEGNYHTKKLSFACDTICRDFLKFFYEDCNLHSLLQGCKQTKIGIIYICYELHIMQVEDTC